MSGATTQVLSAEQRERLGLSAPLPDDPVHAWRVARARLLAWTRRHGRSLAIALPLVAVAVVLRWWGLAHSPALSDDEGTYVAQAWAVQVQHGLAPYTYWYDHPPFGWIQLAGLTWVTGLFGGHGLSIVAARRLMLLYAAADSALLYVLARRLGLRRTLAAAALVAWALSPLAVGYSRMVYLDNIALPWALLAFVAAATPRRNLWAYVGAGASFAVAVLSKETMLLLLPGLLLLVLQRGVRRTKVFCVTGFVAAFVLVAAAYPMLALLKGELLPGPGHVSLMQAAQFQLYGRPSTGSALVAGTQSRTLLDSWLSLDGWLLLVGIVGTPVCLAVRRLRSVGVVMLLEVLGALRPGYLPQPYPIAVLPFAAIAAAGAGDHAWRWVRRRQRHLTRPAGTALVAATAAFGVLLAVLLVPAWVRGDRAMAAGPDQSAPVLAAEHWLERHRPATGARGSAVLVDDTMWADLVTHGYQPQQVVWLYKLDYVANLDPSVRRRVTSYGDFALVVSSPVTRSVLATSGPSTYPIARQAYAHGHVVATFGSGAGRVQVLAVTPPSTARTTRSTQGENG